MNGEASEEEYERLLELSARSCYLHATLATPLEPKVEICLNGNFISNKNQKGQENKNEIALEQNEMNNNGCLILHSICEEGPKF